MLARRDTRREAARLRLLSPLQTLEDQSQTWGICCHSCTGREGLPPSWQLSYKTYVFAVYPRTRGSFQPTALCTPPKAQAYIQAREARVSTLEGMMQALQDQLNQ